VFLSRQVQCHNILQIDNRHDRWSMQLELTGLSQQNTFRTRHSRSILCGDVQRQRGWRSLAAPLSVETPWMWAQYHCDLQRSKGVKLIINDDYTHKYIIHVLNQFDQDIHSRQRQTDELSDRSNHWAYMHIHIHMDIYHLLLAQPTDVTGIWPCSNPIIDVSSFPWRFERYIWYRL
jgi:hypothetical protein